MGLDNEPSNHRDTGYGRKNHQNEYMDGFPDRRSDAHVSHGDSTDDGRSTETYRNACAARLKEDEQTLCRKEDHKRQRLDGRGHYQDPRSAKHRHVLADPNSTLGIFGLSQFVTEDEMKIALAEKLPEIREYSLKMIVDERTGLSKGFCFVDFACLDDAMSAKEILNKESFRGQDFRCDYSYKR